MPKALADFLGLCFYFWSNESSGQFLEPIHVHISKGKPTENATKIWIKKDGSLEIAYRTSDISDKELKKSLIYIAENQDSIIASWYRHFSQ